MFLSCFSVLTNGFLWSENTFKACATSCWGSKSFWFFQVTQGNFKNLHLSHSRGRKAYCLTPAHVQGWSLCGGWGGWASHPGTPAIYENAHTQEGGNSSPRGAFPLLHFVSALSSLREGQAFPWTKPEGEEEKFHSFLFHDLCCPLNQ